MNAGAGALLFAAVLAQRARDPNTYVLKEKDNQKIFDQLIVQEELAHLKDFGHLKDGVQPIVVFVVGQTGSGKTRLAADLLGVMQGRQPAHLIADVYKAYRELPGHLPVTSGHPIGGQ
jgi:pantothenate kinase-related protein Tda10